MIGININDSCQDYTGQILRGEKTVETRRTDSLKPYVGRRVGVIRTGVGPAVLVGYMTIGKPVHYANRSEFRADRSRHLVAEGSPHDGGSFGYPVEDVESISPIPVTSHGIVARRIFGT